jgi:hypothetical protein
MSKFKSRAATKAAQWTMGLGLGTILIFPILVIFTSVLRPILDKVSGENTGISIGFGILAFSLILSVSALSTGFYAYRKGDRSSTLWAGLIPALVVAAFWVFMIIGEFLFPH